MDLNLDAGENAEALKNGLEAQLYELVDSVNVACGGHAGDRSTMTTAVRLAKARGLKVGAHPSFPDQAGFGRKNMKIPASELKASLSAQIRALLEICDSAGVALTHVKAHGALYNLLADEMATARLFLQAVEASVPGRRVIGRAGSAFIELCQAAGIPCWNEGFCDRHYLPDGRLVPRHEPDACIERPTEAAAQALSIARDQTVIALGGIKISVRADTLCIHGDTKDALAIARAVRAVLA